MLRLNRGSRGQERGAVAVIVAVVVGFFVLSGVAALTIDAGSLYAERRVVQNGADAASLALAQICAKDILSAGCANTVYLQDLAGDNAGDGLTSIFSICGFGPLAGPKFGACPGGTDLIDCVTMPTAIPPPNLNFVEVRTRTLSPGATPSVVRKFVAGLGDPSYDGQSVQACARAAWGPPSTGPSAIPVTISVCEYNAYTNNGTNLVAPPPYPPYPTPIGFPYEHAIYQHDERSASPCDQGPSGADFPGGFGYLMNDACDMESTATGMIEARPGNPSFSALNCNFYPHLSTQTGLPIFLPIYNDFIDQEYSMDGMAAFWLTGFSTSSNRQASQVSGRNLCTPSQTCLYGWFTTGIQPVGSIFDGGGGTPRGGLAVGVAG